jgi:hypothetical protein
MESADFICKAGVHHYYKDGVFYSWKVDREPYWYKFQIFAKELFKKIFRFVFFFFL